jgi:IS30 family transposase
MPFHLTKKQRIELSLLRQLGYSMRSAASVLGVSPSTVSRELRRNRAPSRTTYHAAMAERFRLARRAAANDVKHKLTAIHPLLVALVEEKLVLHWSPEQIAGWLKATRHAVRVCAQTIYDWLRGLTHPSPFPEAEVPSHQSEHTPEAATSEALCCQKD